MVEPHMVRAETMAQIRALPRSARPVVVCDVDEVILHMIAPMETYLAERGLRFLTPEHKLTGNIAPVEEDTPLEGDIVRRYIRDFFDEHVHAQDLVPGANVALRRLSAHFDIVLLTNLPGSANKPLRIELLKRFDIDYPLITNSGPKGGAVSVLAAGRRGPIVFIDDSPVNQDSVAASLPSAVRIQFIADPRFRAAHTPADHIHLLTGDWDETTRFIEAILAGEIRL
ncbi:hypothetical protein [Roseibium aestuarii]|uniref:HAD family hydrolase n=1 Tax=Roseibium aestuarii TaxID=2600299 RepID=A0ABW4JZ99_9HYPH|nr:hypothetical protein [Roseibium aestuarii]